MTKLSSHAFASSLARQVARLYAASSLPAEAASAGVTPGAAAGAAAAAASRIPKQQTLRATAATFHWNEAPQQQRQQHSFTRISATSSLTTTRGVASDAAAQKTAIGAAAAAAPTKEWHLVPLGYRPAHAVALQEHIEEMWESRAGREARHVAGEGVEGRKRRGEGAEESGKEGERCELEALNWVFSQLPVSVFPCQHKAPIYRTLCACSSMRASQQRHSGPLLEIPSNAPLSDALRMLQRAGFTAAPVRDVGLGHDTTHNFPLCSPALLCPYLSFPLFRPSFLSFSCFSPSLARDSLQRPSVGRASFTPACGLHSSSSQGRGGGGRRTFQPFLIFPLVSLPSPSLPCSSCFSPPVLEIPSNARLSDALRLLQHAALTAAPVRDVAVGDDAPLQQRYLGMVDGGGIVLWVLGQVGGGVDGLGEGQPGPHSSASQGSGGGERRPAQRYLGMVDGAGIVLGGWWQQQQQQGAGLAGLAVAAAGGAHGGAFPPHSIPFPILVHPPLSIPPPFFPQLDHSSKVRMAAAAGGGLAGMAVAGLGAAALGAPDATSWFFQCPPPAPTHPFPMPFFCSDSPAPPPPPSLSQCLVHHPPSFLPQLDRSSAEIRVAAAAGGGLAGLALAGLGAAALGAPDAATLAAMWAGSMAGGLLGATSAEAPGEEEAGGGVERVRVSVGGLDRLLQGNVFQAAKPTSAGSGSAVVPSLSALVSQADVVNFLAECDGQPWFEWVAGRRLKDMGLPRMGAGSTVKVEESDPVMEPFRLMLQHDIGKVPVVALGTSRITANVSARDVLQLLTSPHLAEQHHLKPLTVADLVHGAQCPHLPTTPPPLHSIPPPPPPPPPLHLPPFPPPGHSQWRIWCTMHSNLCPQIPSSPPPPSSSPRPLTVADLVHEALAAETMLIVVLSSAPSLTSIYLYSLCPPFHMFIPIPNIHRHPIHLAMLCPFIPSCYAPSSHHAMPLHPIMLCPFIPSCYAPSSHHAMPLHPIMLCPFIPSCYAPSSHHAMPLHPIMLCPFIPSCYAPSSHHAMPLHPIMLCPFIPSCYAPSSHHAMPLHPIMLCPFIPSCYAPSSHHAMPLHPIMLCMPLHPIMLCMPLHPIMLCMPLHPIMLCPFIPSCYAPSSHHAMYAPSSHHAMPLHPIMLCPFIPSCYAPSSHHATPLHPTMLCPFIPPCYALHPTMLCPSSRHAMPFVPPCYALHPTMLCPSSHHAVPFITPCMRRASLPLPHPPPARLYLPLCSPTISPLPSHPQAQLLPPSLLHHPIFPFHAPITLLCCSYIFSPCSLSPSPLPPRSCSQQPSHTGGMAWRECESGEEMHGAPSEPGWPHWS
ncbi:unnamed protein product [Closterium sp. Naga37s-1]|nr:unnamed protein product [Closterium sp. Naga37s-1]